MLSQCVSRLKNTNKNLKGSQRFRCLLKIITFFCTAPLENDTGGKQTDQDRQGAKIYCLDIWKFEGTIIKRLLNVKTRKSFVKYEELFDIISEIHIRNGHRGRL